MGGRELNDLDFKELATFSPSDVVSTDTVPVYDVSTDQVKALEISNLSNLAGLTASVAELNIMDGVTATAAEINKACDLSAQEQTITASGAVTAGKKAVFLNHATVAIAATIADASAHQGFFLIKAGLEPGSGQDHTCTITTGTWNGTNKVATFADINDSLFVYFDGSGNGTIITNTGSVALSG